MADEKIKKNLTIFGRETEFNGTLEFSDQLIITGKFHGSILATGDLVIEKNAECNVKEIKAKSIVVSGQVNGKMFATEKIEMCPGSRVIGDVETARIRIANNVDFDGNVSMTNAQNIKNADIFENASEDFKKSLVLKINEAH